MYNIREVKLQNQQDCFSYLYLFLAKECMACFGREGEEIIRPAIRNYGYSLGSQVKERLQKKGKRANLKTLVEEGSDTFTDPRFCFHPLCGTEQVFQLETYICPMALIWKKEEAEHIGTCFCEEYYTGYFAGYSEDAAQTNVSKMLTSDTDCHCRHSVYYRPANVRKEDREQIFTMDERSVTLQAEWKRPYVKPQERGMEHRCLLLIRSIYEEAQKQKGEAGIRAVAYGIRRYARFLGIWMKLQAHTSEWSANDGFLEISLPFPLHADVLQQVCEEEIRRMLQKNFYPEFMKQYKEQVKE